MDARKVAGCKGNICHYIEGVGNEEIAKEMAMMNA